MTRVQIKVEVCDVCQMQGRPIGHYRIAAPGGRVRTVALCEQDARTPLAELVARFANPTQVRHAVASIEEVKSARKRTARKPARARASRE